MRTAEEFRDRQLEMLAKALQRPGFFCGSAGDLFFGDIIRDLLWLEERPDCDTDCISLLLGGSLRVFGQFHYQGHQQPDRYENEVASTYAEAAFRLGYYRPSRLLNDAEYETLHANLTAEFFEDDHTQTELVQQFGQPSHDVLGGQTTVHCYACEDSNRPWVYFDYSRCFPPPDHVTYEWFDDEVLRDIRREENRFELLPFADWFRGEPDTDG